MKSSLFRQAAVAAAVVAVCGAAHAKNEPNHPAVGRALAHLQHADLAARSAVGGHSFDVRDVVIDPDGSEHVRFGRRYMGLRVIGGDLVVHSKGGQLADISQTLQATPAISTAEGIDALAAEGLARGALERSVSPSKVTAEKVIYARGGAFDLAWSLKVVGKQGGADFNHTVIIDAHSGKQLDRWSNIHYDAAIGDAKLQYGGNVKINTERRADGKFQLVDLTRGGHKAIDLKVDKNNPLTSDTNSWGSGTHNTTDSTDAAEAHYGHAMTWDFYKNVLGRNGIRDDGVGATSKVHSPIGPFGILYNAGWNDDCFCMTYSSLKSQTQPALVPLDVSGHEMSHGVTSHTAGLIYANESGGMNEAISDIMGAMVEGYARNPNDPPDSLIAEQPWGVDAPLRYLHRPSLDGRSTDCWYPGVGGLDVHYSSGVGNHWFYLLSSGTAKKGWPASPTCEAGDTKVATGSGALTGIGAIAAVKILYKAMTTYMTEDANYPAIRVATLKAASDLYGAGSKQSKAVADAWTAVNVK